MWSNIQTYLANPSVVITSETLIKVSLVVLILLLSQVLKHFFFSAVFSRIERLANRTDTPLDDALVDILKPPLGWFLFLVALWLGQLLFASKLNPSLHHVLVNWLELAIVVTIAYSFYQLSPLLGCVIGNLTVRTDTELDDLTIPYLPKLFQTAAILIIVLKSSEVLLGVSATAIVGLLGGAGIAFGLLIKDVIYDWCCTVIIYLDDLYHPGDRLVVAGIESEVQVLEIGLRSTKLGILDSNSIQKIPNSNMITGMVENRSQSMSEQVE